MKIGRRRPLHWFSKVITDMKIISSISRLSELLKAIKLCDGFKAILVIPAQTEIQEDPVAGFRWDDGSEASFNRTFENPITFHRLRVVGALS